MTPIYFEVYANNALQLVDRNLCGILPQLFQAVEAACGFQEYMYEGKAVIEQNPARGIMSLNMVRQDAVIRLQAEFHLVSECLNLRRAGRGADDKIFGNRGQVSYLEHLNILSALAVQGLYCGLDIRFRGIVCHNMIFSLFPV